MIDISVNELVKSFEVGQTLLDGLSFDIHEGECVGIMGRNGCGKTTLFRLLTGTANQPFKGHAVEHDVIVVNLTVRTISRGKVAGFALNANNLIQHFILSLSAGLTFFVFFTASTLFFVLFGQVQGLSAFVRIIKLQGAVFFSKNTCVGETTMLYLNSHEISKEC